MTEPRIRWDEDAALLVWSGYVGTAAAQLFTIAAPLPGSGKGFLLMSRLPGMDFSCSRPRLEEAQAEAERWLEEFTASLGAVWPDERDEFEFPRDDLDLEAAFGPGAYVRYQRPDEGWEADRVAGRKLLTHGRLYRVAWNDIGFSKTRIGLVGFKDSFNSVLFEPVSSDDVTDAEAAEVARRNGIATSAPVAADDKE
jgi:hypothetical protein